MNLQELLAVIGAGLWALLWAPCGRVFGVWGTVTAVVLGGFAGLVLGWLFSEWLDRLRPDTRRLRTAVELTAILGACLTFIALPLWVRTLLSQG